MTRFITIGKNCSLNNTFFHVNSNDCFMELHPYAMPHSPIFKEEVEVNEPEAKIIIADISQSYQVIIT